MEFAEDIPITFKEITPSLTIVEKWKEITLDTGGTHSTLQDIKLPPKAGGHWYKDSLKINTKNRFIYWQTTSDAIELTEASFDINLTSANVRFKVAPTTPPLGGVTVWEHFSSNQVIILLATVSSVHRLKFPHPEVFDKKSTFGSVSNSSPSIFHHSPTVTDPKNYHIFNQYSNQGVAHTSASLLRENGEAVFALAFGHSGDGGLLVVKLPTSGSAVTLQLKRESTVPRFLSGITGALRGWSANEGVEPHGVVVTSQWTVAVHGDGALRAWHTGEGGAPQALAHLAHSTLRPRQPPHGHMLQKAQAIDGSVLIVAYLSFPTENEFVVLKLHDEGGGVAKFTNIWRIIGPQLDLLDYNIGFGEGTNVIWALWSQTDGDTIITSSAIGTQVSWRCVANKEPPPPLPQLSSHQQYRDRLMVAGLFPPAVIRKALLIYVRTWGSGASEVSAEAQVGEGAMSAVQARVRHLAARTDNPDHSTLMHKCWSDLYSWCMQYMEGLQKPLGLMLSEHMSASECGWWCAVIRRAGLSLVLPLEPLEQIMLAAHHDQLQQLSIESCVSTGTCAVVAAGAVWTRGAGAGAATLERTLFSSPSPLNALNRLTHHPLQEMLTPQQFEEITAILEPIKDLQSAVLELNDALRLDVPELEAPSDEEDSSDYDYLFSSELGVSLVTESIRQMAEMRSRIVRGALVALWGARGADGVPGAGHCAVHWQAYRALLWLHHAPIHPQWRAAEEAFRLKVQEVWGAVGVGVVSAGGAVRGYAGGRGGRGTRRHLRRARAHTHAPRALPLYTHHLAYQLWAVSGGFEFGSWLATINQPRLVQNYVNLLEPWCEWNACSRRFILGLALLDLEDMEGAYAAFSHAAKGVGKEPLLRTLVDNQARPLSQHQALVLYYMKVIKLFEIHDAGEYVVRLAETAISIADKDDPNLGMFQWVVFKWRLSRGDTAGALSAAAACPAAATRAAAAAALLHALGKSEDGGGGGGLWALVRCGALAGDAERAAATRAKLHDAHAHNPYYDYLFALHVYRQHYRKAAAIAYERACRCGGEAGAAAARRRWTAAALSALRLARPEHAFVTRPHTHTNQRTQVLGPEDLEAELRKDDPNCMDPVQKALQSGELVDLNQLYPHLMKADEDTLLAVTKRLISTEQFMPHWLLLRYLEVSGGGCVSALRVGGRVCEGARGAARLLSFLSGAPFAPLPTAHLDLLLAELRGHNDPHSLQAYEELKQAVDAYTNIVERTSNNMKEAHVGFNLSS